MSGNKPIVIQNRELDLDMQFLCASQKNMPQLNNMGASKARTAFTLLTSLTKSKNHRQVNIEKGEINLDDRSLKIKIFTPLDRSHFDDSTSLPLIIYFHGGGHVIGDLESYSGFCSDLSFGCQAKVISVDYRLAPDSKFPAAAVDAFESYQFLRENAENFDIDPNKILVAGDSAGGNLSLCTCLQAIEKSYPLPLGQVLIYPMTDMRRQYQSYDDFASGFVLTKDLMIYFNEHYLNSEKENTDPLASPLLSENLNNLPRTLVTLAGFDPLRDEGDNLVKRLAEENVEHMTIEHNHLAHGFITLAGVIENAKKANEEIIKVSKDFFF